MKRLAAFLLLAVLVAVWFLASHSEGDGEELGSDIIGKKQALALEKYVQVDNAPAINPFSEKDFALLVWFNSKTKIDNGGRLPIIYKFEIKQGQEPGYALSLSNSNNVIRPEIYWQNAAGAGRWYSFAEFPFQVGKWTGFKITFKQGKFLGLTAYKFQKKEGIHEFNLGGYNLDGLLAASSADLKVGSVGNKTFRGQVGTIYSGTGLLADDWADLIRQKCSTDKKIDLPYCNLDQAE